MKKCKYCGKELNEWGASYCQHCHKKQEISFFQGVSVVIVILFISGVFLMVSPQIGSLFQKKSDNGISIINDNSSGLFDESNINKKIICNGREILIKKLQRVNNSTNSYVPQNKEWIGVYIIYKNVSKKDINYSETDFHLVNYNKNVLDPLYAIVSTAFDHDRLNSGTLASGGKVEGYVVFSNDKINDKNLTLRFTCEENFISDDQIAIVELK